MIQRNIIDINIIKFQKMGRTFKLNFIMIVIVGYFLYLVVATDGKKSKQSQKSITDRFRQLANMEYDSIQGRRSDGGKGDREDREDMEDRVKRLMQAEGNGGQDSNLNTNQNPQNKEGEPQNEDEYPEDEGQWPWDEEEWPQDEEEWPQDEEEWPQDEEEWPYDEEEWPQDEEEWPYDEEEWPQDEEELNSEPPVLPTTLSTQKNPPEKPKNQPAIIQNTPQPFVQPVITSKQPQKIPSNPSPEAPIKPQQELSYFPLPGNNQPTPNAQSPTPILPSFNQTPAHLNKSQPIDPNLNPKDNPTTSLESQTLNEKKDNMIITIISAVAGLVVLAIIIGIVVAKRKKKEDEEETNQGQQRYQVSIINDDIKFTVKITS